MLAKQIALARYNNKPDPFKKIEFPTLIDIAMLQVSNNFELYPHLEGIADKYKHIIISNASKDLPVVITFNSIEDENYWKQACDSKWKGSHRTINICKHSYIYKVAYMENYLEEYLRSIKSLQTPQEKEEFIKQLKAVSRWIFSVTVTQTSCNIDIGLLCQYLPCLQNLTIVYGVKTAGMDYKKEGLGMRLSQAAELGEAISKHCRNLQSLSLPSNLIDEDLLRLLMTGINLDISIIELNLSHNKIGDKGMRRIAKYLMRSEILLKLDLSNNAIGYEGSRCLSYALKINKSLETLNLALNQFDDKAGSKFFADLVTNKQLLHLNLSANQLSTQTALKINDYISDSGCPLQTLNISNNNFSEEVHEQLKTALIKNTSLVSFDISKCKFKMGIQESLEKDLQDVVVQSRLKMAKIPFVTREDFIYQQAQAQLRKEKQEQNNIQQAEIAKSPLL